MITRQPTEKFMLQNLDPYPLPDGAIVKKEIPDTTRILAHEAGHAAEAAAAGIPTDYIIFDGAPERSRHAGYIDETYRARLESDKFLAGRILAAGFAAEMVLFGAAELSISSEDLHTLAEHIGIPKTDDWMNTTALCALQRYKPVVSQHVIKAIYAKLVSAIKSEQYLVDGAHIVPIDAFDNLVLAFPIVDYWRAFLRTKNGLDRKVILATLRAGVTSGV
jgi:hypothetical protein